MKRSFSAMQRLPRRSIGTSVASVVTLITYHGSAKHRGFQKHLPCCTPEEFLLAPLAGQLKPKLDSYTLPAENFVLHTSRSAHIESLREQIKLIQNQERFYRTVKRYSFGENAAHIRREIRLLEIQAEIGRLQQREMCV
jgi:hypothetical protein